MAKWIEFEHLPPKPGMKTSIWIVKTKEGGETLGLIKWFGNWRKYSFFPVGGTIYESNCLMDISGFMKNEMDLRKKEL